MSTEKGEIIISQNPIDILEQARNDVQRVQFLALSPHAVDTGVIVGQTVVKEGLHVRYEGAYPEYEKTLRKLGVLEGL